MAVATAMEEEAAARYRQMSNRMRLQGEESLAGLFTFLAGIEEKHAAHVRERSVRFSGHVPDTGAIRWELPEKFEEEESRSYLLTPYRALAIAVRNEDRAFAFYSYLAAHAETAEIRRIAEELAKDELDHAALLRRERRKAWRTERPAQPSGPADAGAFLARIAAIESFTARAHRALAARLVEQGRTFEAGVFEEAAEDEERGARDAESRSTGPAIVLNEASPETLRDGLRLLEYAFDQYAEVADKASDELVLTVAQEFEARALRRLSYVQGLIGEAK
jgi:rubrerythrin